MDFTEQLSPEQREEMGKLLEMMGSGFGATDHTIKGLCDSHPELVKHLAAFERTSAVRLISCLETYPDLHENTIRFEVLIHLAVCCCKGDKAASLSELRHWISLLDTSPMASQEDPTEDVFIGYTCTPHGGFRIFQGLFTHADFILERLLAFLAEKTNFPGYTEPYQSIIELLKISDAIADGLGLARYSIETSPSSESISLPADELLEEHAQAVSFDQERIDLLGLDYQKLSPFVFDCTQIENLESQPLFGSKLEHCPLLQSQSGLVVASPSSLCRAAIVHVLSVAPRLGGWADTFFEKECAEFFINEIIRRLGIRPTNRVKLPKQPESLPPLFAHVGQFDHGKPVLNLMKCSRITQGTDLEEMEMFTDEQATDFTQYLDDCCKACETVEGFQGGLVLIGLSSVGRPSGISLESLRPNWHLHCATLADWQTLVCDSGFSAKRLWYLGLQEDLAEKANIQIFNPSGLLNLYGFWRENDYSIIPNNLDTRNPNNMLVIDGSYSLRVNSHLKRTDDRHCRTYVNGEWVLLRRQGAGLNPDLTGNLTYCDYEAASNGILRGCVEFGDIGWWIETGAKPEEPGAHSLMYRLWDCVFNWVEQALPVLSENFAGWLPQDLVIDLVFPDIDEWNLDGIIHSKKDTADLSAHAGIGTDRIQLIFAEGFLKKFYSPENLAEREIVSQIIEAAAISAGQDVTKLQIAEITTKITKDENSRFFHVLRSPSLESALGGADSASPTFIPEEEVSRARLGLAHAVTPNPPAKIIELKAATKFLDSAVATIQQRIIGCLKGFNILSVVSYSFQQLDELSRDSSRWELSTRSLISLERGAPWLQERLRTESGRLAFAEICNRALIETAVYSHNPASSEIISQTQHASLLADLSLMIELANHRDAIAHGFVEADLKINPNGTIQYDASFQRKVFEPYIVSKIDDRIQSAAENYSSNFDKQPNETSPHATNSPEIVAFERAFRSEYGFDYDALIKFIDHFDEIAVEQKRAGGIVSALILRKILKFTVGLSEHQITSFIDRFVLPIRPKWNEKKPKSYLDNDVLPWRYYRGLSLLVRPIVEVSRSPRNYAISAPHLHRWQRYLTGAISDGYLPDHIFQSAQMKSYLGSIAYKKGSKFTRLCGSELETILPDLRVEVNLTEMGAPQIPDLGDIDVLAWNKVSGQVFLIECKRLKTALTTRQVIQQLEDFKGGVEDQNYLSKHQRRVRWLEQNPAGVSKITGIPEDSILWVPLLVTSGRVPMAFVDAVDFKKEQVVPFQELMTTVASLIPQESGAATS